MNTLQELLLYTYVPYVPFRKYIHFDTSTFFVAAVISRIYLPAQLYNDCVNKTTVKLQINVKYNSGVMSSSSSDDDVDPEVNANSSIACIPKVKSNTPRARFDIHFHSDYIRLFQFNVKKEVSNRHKIDRDDVIEMFRLPVDNQQIFFVLHLSNAMVGGNKHFTKYHFVVFNFIKNEDIEIELRTTDCEEIRDILETDDDNIVSGKTVDVFEKMVKHIFNKPVICPTIDSSDNYSTTPVLKCTFWDSDDHYLYPLDDCFITVWKYCQRVRLTDVKNVRLVQGEGRSRTFDFYIYPTVKTQIRRYNIGAAASKFLNCWYLEFKAIDQTCYEWLYEYCERHQITIETNDFEDQAYCSSNSNESSDSDTGLGHTGRMDLKHWIDNEFEAPDPYMARCRNERSNDNEDSIEESDLLSDQQTDGEDENPSNQPTASETSGSQASNNSSVVGKNGSNRKRAIVVSDSSSNSSVNLTPRKRRSIPQVESDDES